ncbi:hypothetical protein [Anatilimnocola floriformis]|uniref:hypothetical protein n=1 Tax=Anatilimnocola floriformis TaxID=2948575 RepID=UPI0020C40A5F|nr:hypothetical protein [Anatilimnocola floriformis]
MLRRIVVSGVITVLFLVCGLMSSTASAQTALAGGFEITLPAGAKHETQRGIDSSPGKITAKGGLEIYYDIGVATKPGAPRLGGGYMNAAARVPMDQVQWTKEQTVGGHTFSITYSKDKRLYVSTAGMTHGVNFSAPAETPGDVADVLLITLSLAEKAK